MSLALFAAPFDDDDDINVSLPSKPSSVDGKSIMSRLRNKGTAVKQTPEHCNDDDSNCSLVDYNPTAEYNKPYTNQPYKPSKDSFAYENAGFFNTSSEPDVSNTYVPPINPTSDVEIKLNRLIGLLEDQNKRSTEYITEEIVLYLFLGVFIIYTIDSFTRVGKYTR